MIARVKVKNYQSIRQADLELGRFTVIVGPSSSGKSALMRALRLLASNSRGASYVTHGEKLAVVTAELEDGSVVSIERGESHGQYEVLLANNGDLEAGWERTFTKLGGAVPEEVTRILRIEPSSGSSPSINFAGQFDRPYLLDASPAEVARQLGELTNVSVIFNAAREAGRRLTSVKSSLKTRESDLASLLEQAQQFKGLKERIEASDRAGQILQSAAQVERSVKTLRDVVQRLEYAVAARERSEQLVVEVPSPDLARVDTAFVRRQEFLDTLSRIKQSRASTQQCEQELVSAADSLNRLEVRYHEVLVEAGECPLCGQSTKELESV